MGGSKIGGIKARNTCYKKYGKNFYRDIGRIGGKLGHVGGFNNHDLAVSAGRLGGSISRRGKAKKNEKNISRTDTTRG